MSSSTWGHVALGQVLSLCFTGAITLNRELNSRYSLDLVSSQTLVVYVYLAIIFWTFLAHFSVEYFGSRNFYKNFYSILLISIMDTAANLLCMRSLHFLSMTTASLVSTLTTPIAMIFSYIILRTKYSWRNIFGASIATSGVVGVCLFDTSATGLSSSGEEGSSSLFVLGLVLCLSSAVAFGVSNVLTERVIKKGETIAEFTALNALFSSFWNLLYLYRALRPTLYSHLFCSRLVFRWVELDQMRRCITSSAIVYFMGYCALMIIFYIALPIMMSKSSAVMFNLSLLTINFLSFFVDVYRYGKKVSSSPTTEPNHIDRI